MNHRHLTFHQGLFGPADALYYQYFIVCWVLLTLFTFLFWVLRKDGKPVQFSGKSTA